MKRTILFSLFLLPQFVFASLPDFPMSFYGAATINGAPAPVGTVVRAYYGTELAGEVTVLESGIYGYDNPSKQQLLLKSGTGTIRFAATVASLNGGAEIAHAAPLPAFTFLSGVIEQEDLVFVFTPPAPPAPTPTPTTSSGSSGGGGGGGGGGGTSVLYGCMDPKATNYSSIANRDNGACLYAISAGVATTSITTTANSSSTTVVSPAPARGEVLGASAYFFGKNLALGSKGNDVTELQKRLTAEGHYSGPITGYFGPMTAAAVKRYQAANGLETVGNVGPKTRAALNGADAPAVLGASTSAGGPQSRETTLALIQQLLTMIDVLQKQLAELKAAQGR